MRRTYDRERYLDRVALIREHVPDASLTTDIIVGFPGETEADFAETLEVAEQVGYDSAFTFIFSPRRGTTAAELTEGLVPHPVKVERMERLLEVVQRRARERAQRFVGRTVEVLVEGPSRTDPERLRGRTRHNKAVNFSGLAAPGELTEVRDHRRHQPDALRRGTAAGKGGVGLRAFRAARALPRDAAGPPSACVLLTTARSLPAALPGTLAPELDPDELEPELPLEPEPMPGHECFPGALLTVASSRSSRPRAGSLGLGVVGVASSGWWTAPSRSRYSRSCGRGAGTGDAGKRAARGERAGDHRGSEQL